MAVYAVPAKEIHRIGSLTENSLHKNPLGNFLERIHALTSTMMIHVTHSFDEAFLLGSRLAIMNHGEIVQVGEPSEVVRKPNCTFAAEFLGVTNVFRGESKLENGIVSIDINGLRVTSTDSRDGQSLSVYQAGRYPDIAEAH
jgi:ABC-type Fe3+/spermidine/putrescine transport system ATPase subunit